MEQKTYIFNAIFTYDDDGISIVFPDLPGCFSCGSDEEALRMAKEALKLYLEDMTEIPRPSELGDIIIKNKNQTIFPIEITI
jgi:predicted RNase H-like HicB family nuclease